VRETPTYLDLPWVPMSPEIEKTIPAEHRDGFVRLKADFFQADIPDQPGKIYLIVYPHNWPFKYPLIRMEMPSNGIGEVFIDTLAGIDLSEDKADYKRVQKKFKGDLPLENLN